MSPLNNASGRQEVDTDSSDIFLKWRDTSLTAKEVETIFTPESHLVATFIYRMLGRITNSTMPVEHLIGRHRRLHNHKSIRLGSALRIEDLRDPRRCEWCVCLQMLTQKPVPEKPPATSKRSSLASFSIHSMEMLSVEEYTAVQNQIKASQQNRSASVFVIMIQIPSPSRPLIRTTAAIDGRTSTTHSETQLCASARGNTRSGCAIRRASSCRLPIIQSRKDRVCGNLLCDQGVAICLVKKSVSVP